MKYAFTAVVEKDYMGIGKAIEGTKGYVRIPEGGQFQTYDEARAKADKMNEQIGLTKKEAWIIVIGTMSHNK